VTPIIHHGWFGERTSPEPPRGQLSDLRLIRPPLGVVPLEIHSKAID
jgi:hypothetical protein